MRLKSNRYIPGEIVLPGVWRVEICFASKAPYFFIIFLGFVTLQIFTFTPM